MDQGIKLFSTAAYVKGLGKTLPRTAIMIPWREATRLVASGPDTPVSPGLRSPCLGRRDHSGPGPAPGTLHGPDGEHQP